MAFNLKDIEAKLNSFSDKMNEIGNQVSDALNSGASSFDNALNSCVNGIDNKMEEYVQVPGRACHIWEYYQWKWVYDTNEPVAVQCGVL